MSAEPYADYLFLRYVSQPAFDEEFGSDWRSREDVAALLENIIAREIASFGYKAVGGFEELIKQNLVWFKQHKVLVEEGDKYTGFYCCLDPNRKNLLASDYLAGNEISKRINLLGPAALARAIDALAAENGWIRISGHEPLASSFSLPPRIPASDRIVTLSDNQTSELETATTQVIDIVSSQNQINDIPSLREMLIGQLKAGRELIRSGCVRVYLVEITMMQALKMLVSKYEHDAIGALAQALIALLISHLGINA